MNNSLVPINGCVLVALEGVDNYIDVPDKQFSTKACGYVVAISDNKHDTLLGKKVFFEEYRDSAQVDVNDNKFAFIKYEDIRGYQDEQTISKD